MYILYVVAVVDSEILDNNKVWAPFWVIVPSDFTVSPCRTLYFSAPSVIGAVVPSEFVYIYIYLMLYIFDS